MDVALRYGVVILLSLWSGMAKLIFFLGAVLNA